MQPEQTVAERVMKAEVMSVLDTLPPREKEIIRLRYGLGDEERPHTLDEVGGDPTDVIDRLWKPIAHEQAERRKREERATHRLTMLPGVSRRSGLLLGPLQGLLVDA